MSIHLRDVYLGLDVGDVRIGVALSRSGFICEPLLTIERRGRKQTLDAIAALILEHNATVLVLGLPLLERGVEGEQVEKTREFSRSLARRFPKVRIDFQDERHTSGDARDHAGSRLRDGGPKGLVDRLAAAFILQQYLDRRNEGISEILGNPKQTHDVQPDDRKEEGR